MRQQVKGFTLIEVLVVVAIIALLVSILLPSLARARETAQRVACGAGFMNVGKAWHMYANEHKDWYPPCQQGGFFSGTSGCVFDFNKRYFDTRRLGGDAFMCPTWEPGLAPNGKPYDWDNLVPILGSLGSCVVTGYDFWTHLVWDPYTIRDGQVVVDTLLGVREHTRKFLPTNSEGTWAEAMVDRGMVVPWLDKSTDIGGQVRDTSDMSTFTYFRRRTSPSDQKMAWDQVHYNETLYGKQGFHPAITMHYRNGPTGMNILHGDGHVVWRRFKQLIELDQGGGYKQYFCPAGASAASSGQN